jgi:exopolysaccharide biosynthesis polyprenyl glycosylphosphotransferase
MIGKKISEYSVMGSLDDLPRILESTVIDEVVYVVPRSWLPVIEKCILYCEAVGVRATLATDFFDLEIARGTPQQLDGFTYLTFETSRLKHTEFWIKRSVDIIFSFIFLFLSAPLFILIALAIKLDSKGPVFFKQLRCGVNGRKFYVYKFRSMVPDAEKKLEELRSQNEMSGPVFKITKDPRQTRVGKFLRKTSLDEFPQFWNVLKGDMSLVGPRPPIPKEVEQYEPWQRRRLSMKPGITCIWQVSGRNQIGFEDWMKLDLQYIDRWSLWLDFKIILQTVRAVLGQTGK